MKKERHPHQSLLYSLIALFLSFGMAVGINIYINARAIRESEQKLCGVVITLKENRNQNPPPQTEYGIRLADSFDRLANDLRCSDEDGREVRDNG